MDIVIMLTAIAELLNYPLIPVAVTLQRVHRDCQRFKHRQSGQFINGILYSVIRSLHEEGNSKRLFESTDRTSRLLQRKKQNKSTLNIFAKMTLLTILLQQGGGGGLEMILLIVAMFAHYVLPDDPSTTENVRRDKEIRDALTKGDKIVTAGGIYGTIRDTKGKCVHRRNSRRRAYPVWTKGSVYPLSSRRSPEHRKPE